MATLPILAALILLNNMEPARLTDKFTRRITVADSNNIVTVLDLNVRNSKYQIFEEDYLVEFQVALEDVKCTVGLFGLSPAPFPEINALMSEAARTAEIVKVQTEGQKIGLGLYTTKGNEPWVYQSRIVLQNQGGDENHMTLMVPHLGTNETLLVSGNFKLGVRIEPIWNQPLKAQDYIVVTGTYKQVVSFSKKKDDGIEALSDRISALETLLSVYGAPSANLPGSNGLVPAPPAGSGEFLLRGDRNWENPSKFATPAQITAAINNLVGNSSTALDTLAELAAALANDANFATTIANALATKVSLTNDESILGTKTFSRLVTSFKEIVSKGVGSLSNIFTETAARLFATGGGAFLSLTCATAPANSRAVDLGLNSTGVFSLRRVNDAYNSAVNVFQVDSSGNFILPGFTNLGESSIGIKIKTLVFATGTTQGSTVSVVHGLTGSKIVGFTCKVAAGTANHGFPASHKVNAGYEYDVLHDGTYFYVTNSISNSGNILSKPITILIFYSS